MTDVLDRQFNRVELNWAGGEHAFQLGLGEIRALQDKTQISPPQLLSKLQNWDWQIDYPFDVMRFGLIGAGMAKDEARRLVMDVTETTPATRVVMEAVLVLSAALLGVQGDDPGEVPAPEGPTPHPSGASPKSTETGS